MSTPPVDFGILTIREDEVDAVLARFADKLETVKGRRRYNLRRVELPGGDAYTIAIVRCIEQGNAEAQAAARDLLEDLDPSWLLVVGIAGGVPAYELTLGDVVVSTRVLDFSVEAVLEDPSREYALVGGPVAWDAATLAANLPAMADELAGWNAPEVIGMARPPVVLDPARFYGDEAWQADVRAKLEHQFKGKPPRPPLVTAGAIASSDRLMKDAELLGVWLKIARQAVAVEMESAGVYRAARGRGKETPFLAIRGLSDVVGYKRDPAWTSYACRTAAAFAYGLLRTRPVEPRVKTTRLAEPAPAYALFAPSLPRVEHFVGREALAERLRDLLLVEPSSRVLLLGSAGIGKTTLAVAVLHRPEILERFEMRRFFVRLDGAQDADEAAGALVSALGLTPKGDPLEDACRALERERAVVVLDNLETPWKQDREATEALLGKLAAVAGLSLIATIRGAQHPAGLLWSETMAVKPLGADDAVALVVAVAPEHRAAPHLASLLAPLGGVPLAITLFARAAEGNDLENLAAEWDRGRTELLVREGARLDRLSSWAVSIDLSFSSARMTEEARRLAGVLAELPDGIAQEDLSTVLPEAGPSAARVLAQVGLGFFEGRRLRMLAPVREHVARAHPAAPQDLDLAMKWYGELARDLGPNVLERDGEEANRRLDAEAALPTGADIITELRVKNLRTLADVRLRLDGLTVLIGDNGSGKSSLVEVCEILRRAAGPSFGEELFGVHGGPAALLRLGATEITLGVRIEGGGEPIDYELSIDESGQISKESLILPGRWIIDRKSRHTADVLGLTPEGSEIAYKDEKTDGRRLVLTSGNPRHLPHPALARVVAALERIDVQVPFEVTPAWLARSTQRPSALRSPAVTQPVDRLSKLGTNLANAYAALKNDFGEEHWHATMSYVRLGLGDAVESVNVRPDPGGGSIALWLKYANVDQQLPASALSDGMLAYLAMVALYRLDTHASILAFDEPELHLHPDLLMRALDFFEAMARDRPVLLATHSDRLLDGLSEPARAVVLCELDEERRTRLVRPDKEALDRWLERYRGLGDLRGAGHQASVITRAETP